MTQGIGLKRSDRNISLTSLLAISFGMAVVAASIATGDAQDASDLLHMRRSIIPDHLPGPSALVFSDGEQSQIASFRVREDSRQSIVSIGGQYSSLLNSARAGDAEAALAVARAQQMCSAEIDAPGTLPPTSSAESRLLREKIERIAEQRAAACETVDSTQESAREWLLKAAELGSVSALLEASELEGPSQLSVAMLSRGWEQGSLRALWDLSNVFRVGDPTKGLERDLVRSMAYQWLHMKLYELAFTTHSTDSDFVTALRRKAETNLAKLAPDERLQVENAAKEILAQSNRCCELP